VREINTTPQGFKGPNYEKHRKVLLRKETLLLNDVLKPMRSSWGNIGVYIISDGWTCYRTICTLIKHKVKERKLA
jgi:hypothetical protein